MNVIDDRIYFDFHGIASMAVDANAPTAALLHDIFFPFVTARQIKNPDLVVTGAPKPVADPSFGETEYDYTETSLYLHDSEVQILKHGEQYEVNGTRELLVSALPIIDRILVTKGVGMVHAATIEYKGQAINLPAWGGTGKTSTIAKLLRRDGTRSWATIGPSWPTTGGCSRSPSRCSSSRTTGRSTRTFSLAPAIRLCRFGSRDRSAS